MYLSREMYTYKDMECFGKIVRPTVEKVTSWFLNKVLIA